LKRWATVKPAPRKTLILSYSIPAVSGTQLKTACLANWAKLEIKTEKPGNAHRFRRMYGADP
jgi:hypothetical protein